MRTRDVVERFRILCNIFFVTSFISYLPTLESCKHFSAYFDFRQFFNSITLVIFFRCLPLLALPLLSRPWTWAAPPRYYPDYELFVSAHLSRKVFGEWETRTSSSSAMISTPGRLLGFALRPVLGFLVLDKFFDTLHFLYGLKSTTNLAYFLTLVFVVEGFGVAQVLKHMRSHYRIFVGIMTYAVCYSFEALGADNAYTWIVVGLCLALVFIKHLVFVLDDEAYLVRFYCSHTCRPRHRINNYPRFQR